MGLYEEIWSLLRLIPGWICQCGEYPSHHIHFTVFRPIVLFLFHTDPARV
jgi:hypothetical protein